jgi:hypothetical protein
MMASGSIARDRLAQRIAWQPDGAVAAIPQQGRRVSAVDLETAKDQKKI